MRPPSVAERDWHRHAPLYLLRLSALLCAMLVPAFSVLYRASDPSVVDPLWARGAVEALALGAFALSFVSAAVRRHARGILLFGCFATTAVFAALTAANAFAADYAVGFFFVWVASAMTVSLAFDEVLPLTAYNGFTVALTLALLVLHPAPAVDGPVYLACMLAASALVYVAVSTRIQIQGVLRERERLLAEAQRAAGLGNWEVDAANGRVRWSDEMGRIAGLGPEEPPSFDAFAARVHFDDRAALFAFFDALRAGAQPGDLTVRLGLADGCLRVVRLRGALKRGPGRAGRLLGIALDVTDEAARARALVEAKEQAERAREEAETARREAERVREEAERARSEAEEMARLKSAFLANMSHEIRTPLTAIIGFAQVLLEEVDAGLREFVTPIEQSGRRLLATLNSVLDLARLRADGVELDLRAVDVAEEAHEIAALLRPLAREKGLALTVEAPARGVVAHADRTALQRVLTNLLSNAIKFTDAGRVTISVEATAARVRIRVRDTGRGMAPAFLPRLFEEFRQESTGPARSHEGTGLGLAITKGLVDLMGGAITVESAEGEGSAFTVTLPRSQPAAAPERLAAVAMVAA
jgi:signal transduction histidine kinase